MLRLIGPVSLVVMQVVTSPLFDVHNLLHVASLYMLHDTQYGCNTICTFWLQLQELKETAKQHFTQILEQQASSSYSSSSGNGSNRRSSVGAVDTQQLRTKLENAIRVMQTGLVERDTEVSANST